MSDPVTVDVYFDFACPYVHRAAQWLRDVESQLGSGQIEINWKCFPLEQVNAAEDARFAIWELPADRRSRGRDSLHAAVAARRQGEDAFRRFHTALLALKHDQERDHGDSATILEAANSAGLDMTQFAADLSNRSLLEEVRDDYLAGRERHNVFGTPTFVFANGNAAYLKLQPVPPPEEAVPFWDDFVCDVRDRPFVREIKRPRDPQ